MQDQSDKAIRGGVDWICLIAVCGIGVRFFFVYLLPCICICIFSKVDGGYVNGILYEANLFME